MADPTPRLLLWGCAVAIEAVATYAGHPVPGRGRTTTGDYQVAGEHLVERFRLFFLIALGETVVTSSTAFTAQPVAPLRVTALIVAFTGTVAIWWIYFHRAEGAAFELLDDGDGGDHGGLGRLATYSLYGMIAGLIVAAVGDQLVIARPGGDTDAVTSVVLYAGPRCSCSRRAGSSSRPSAACHPRDRWRSSRSRHWHSPPTPCHPSLPLREPR